MKRKIKIGLITIMLSALLIAVSIYTNTDKSFLQDDVLFAVTLDGVFIDYFPERGKYDVVINCKNGTGKWLPEDWKFVIEDVSGDVSCTLDFTSDPSSLNYIVEKNSQTNENGYRYTGKNPNNYIWFNNEMWRILGSIPTRNENGTIENSIKIIRDNSLGNIAHGLVNDDFTWGSNKLYILLNEYYYGKKNADTSDYCYASYTYDTKLKCDYSVIGISPDDYYGSMVENVYWNTGTITSSYTKLTASAFYDEEITEQVNQGYVGLMSASDYGYATNSSYYNQYIYNYHQNIASDNWLYQYGNEWILTNDANYTFMIEYNGSLRAALSPSYGYNVRPVVYLDPSVYVVSGTGTEANPYQIAM